MISGREIAEFFSRKEFECKCGCGFDTVDAELLNVVSDVREHFGEPVTINSAARCVQHNKNIGGHKNSYHLYGQACDIIVNNVDPVAVQNYLKMNYPNSYGIGSYSTFTHIDVQQTKKRWIG